MIRIPLFCGQKNVGRNIKTLMNDGYPHKQAVAIALSHQRKCLGQSPYKPKKLRKGAARRGFKKCVLDMLAKTRVRKNMCLRKCLSEAIKKCK